MFSHLYHIFYITIKIIKTNTLPRKYRVWFNYSWLYIKCHFLFRRNKHIRSSMFLGYKIHFGNFRSFLYLIEEIFINESYYFSTDKEKVSIIDCGSNIGLSILYLKLLYPKSNIKGFEPDPRTFEVLCKNLKEFGFSSVEVFNLALSNHEGVIQFFTDEYTNSPQMSIYRRNSSNKSVNVKTVKLSSYIDSEIDFIKMDIEGAEIFCLEDLHNSQKMNVIKKIYIECHHNMESNPKCLKSVLSYIEDNGANYSIQADGDIISNKAQDVLIRADFA